MSTAANGTRAAVWSALKLGLVYCLAGPVIGLVVLAFGLAVATVANGKPDGYLLVPFVLLYGIVFAHLIGIAWALLAAVAALGLWRMTGGTPAWIGPASGICSYAAAVASGHIVLPPPSAEGAAVAPDAFGTAYLVVMAAVHIVAATVCWLASRRALRPA